MSSLVNLADQRTRALLEAHQKSLGQTALGTDQALSSIDIQSSGQANTLLEQHYLFLQGRSGATEPTTKLDEVLNAVQPNLLNRRSLEVLVDILNKATDASTKAKIVARMRDAYLADPQLIPTSVSQESVLALIDFVGANICSDTDAKSNKVIEFANYIGNDRVDAFATQVKANTPLAKLLSTARAAGLETDLKGLEKRFVERFSSGEITRFEDYPIIRDFLATKLLSARRAFVTTPGRVYLTPSTYFDTVRASAAEMTAVSSGQVRTSKNFSLNEVMDKLLKAGNEDQVRAALGELHTMISVLEHRWVNASFPPVKTTAAQQMETLYSIVKNKTVMGNELLEIFQNAIKQYPDVMAEIPENLRYSTQNNQDHLYTTAAQRLTSLGYSPATNLANFRTDLNRLRTNLQRDSKDFANRAIPIIFAREACTSVDIDNTKVALEVMTCIDDSAALKVDFTSKASSLQSEIIEGLLDKFNYLTGDMVNTTDANNNLILQMYVGSIPGTNPISRADLKTFLTTKYAAGIVPRMMQDNITLAGGGSHYNSLTDLKLKARTAFEINNVRTNPKGVRDYFAGFISKGLVNAASVSQLKTISSVLRGDGTITPMEETRINIALDAYSSSPVKAERAFIDLCNHFLGTGRAPAASQDDLYISIYESLGINNGPNDKTFYTDPNHLLTSIGTAVENLYDSIIHYDENNDAEVYLFEMLKADEIASRTATAIDKHPAQSNRGPLSLLMCSAKMGTEDITGASPKLLALAKIIKQANEDLRTGTLTGPGHSQVMKYLEEKLRFEFRYHGGIATNLDTTFGGNFNNRYNDSSRQLREYAHYGMQMAQFNISIERGGDGALPRRTLKLLGKEQFQSLQPQVEAAQKFIEAVTSGSMSSEGWLQQNSEADHGIIKLAYKMAGLDNEEDFGSLKGLQARKGLDDTTRPYVVELIQNFIKYYMRLGRGKEA